jgi:hypothetical protein
MSAKHVRLIYVWSSLELTKTSLLVGKTRFLGNGVGYEQRTGKPSVNS